MRPRNVSLLSVLGLLGSLIVTVFCRRRAPPETIPPGVYRTTRPVRPFSSVVLRAFQGQRYAVAFLGGMPEHYFLNSFETTPQTVQTVEHRGWPSRQVTKSSYYLLENRDKEFKWAEILTRYARQPKPFSRKPVIACISDGDVFLMIGTDTLPMMRTSVDPNQILEAPSEPPPPGLYLNNGSIPDPYLSDVLLTYADEGWSIRFTFWDNSTVSFQAQAYRRDPGRRCFWLGESVDRRLLFRRTPIPKQHMLSFIRASDVGICQTLESRLYLVLETLTIPLKPATVEPEEPSDTAESSVDAPSAAKRQRSSSESDAIDSPTVKRLGRRSTNTKELEGVNGQATEGDGSLTTASVVGTGRTQSDELAQLESSQGGVPSKLQEPSYAPAPSTHPAPEKKDADEATAVPGESFDNTMGQLEPRLDEETLDWLTENEEDLLRWVEEGI